MADRVYVLGAGASRSDTMSLSLPMPLATDFFRTEYIKSHWPELREGAFEGSALAVTLGQYFHDYSEKSPQPLSHVSVEQAYSFLDVAQEVYGSLTFHRSRLVEARRQLLYFITEVVRAVPWHFGRLKLHEWILGRLGPSDSVLSFNWDLLFDNLLEAQSVGQGLLDRQLRLMDPMIDLPRRAYEKVARDSYEQGHYLKLHGSIIGRCVNSSCRRHDSPYRFSLREDMPQGWHCMECGSSIEVLLVPPHVNKSYRGSRFLGLQARIAGAHLSRAEEIFVIGYSFPLFDFEAETMFRLMRLEPDQVLEQDKTVLRRVVLVNPDVRKRSYVERAKDLFGLHLKKYHGHKVSLVTYSSVDKLLAAER